MDYTLHKLQREAQRRLEKEQESNSQNAGPAELEDGPQSIDATKQSSNSGSDFSPTTQRRKSILKSPTVRFKTDDEPTMPFPPPPQVNAHGGPPPMLFPTMQPLPPGPPMPLDLFAPGSSTYINTASMTLYTKFMDELANFVSMQGDVIQTRVQVQEKRRRVKLYRENVAKCDMEFINYLRQCKANGTVLADPELERLFEASHTARDEVGPEEDDYEALEVQLGGFEYVLKEKYQSLETRFENFFKLRATSTTNKSAPSSIDFEPPSAPSDPDERQWEGQEPRQYTLFQGAFVGDKVRVGQLPVVGDISKVDDAEQQPDHEPLSGIHGSSDTPDQARRNRSVANNVPDEGGSQPPDDLRGMEPEEPEWTAPEFESRETRMNISLREIMDLPTITEGPERFLEDLNVEQSFGDGDSLLLLGSDSDTQSTLSDYLMQFESTRNRVNRWLLHKLRVSPLEVFELRRKVLESPQLIPDWANRALDLWENDTTENGPSHFPDPFQDVPDAYPSTKDLPSRHRRRRKDRDVSNVIGDFVPLPQYKDHGSFAFDPNTQGVEMAKGAPVF
ncbi:hypothetical protein K505DRAFT_374601 [Melanomma pulvis-pyrius CBS 109.77]|uniref:Uncharacterized protein n=1 Tax=Melanomma pulvis-pyrius CBS 109.77 TaxID=1314802 RepID=A0A6A6XED5_9PLEO|nr:hypothetical protein K505DRAFT_374601 [Melanomma pulvis-pyrius CBS 109.77]